MDELGLHSEWVVFKDMWSGEAFTNWLTGISDRPSTLDMRVCRVPGTQILDKFKCQVVSPQTTKEPAFSATDSHRISGSCWGGSE